MVSRTCNKYLMMLSESFERSNFCTIIGFVSARLFGKEDLVNVDG